MTTHELKCWPNSYDEITSGRKTFEYRTDNRGYDVGHLLHLRRFDPDNFYYTGEHILVEVTSILRGSHGMPEGFVCMSIAALASTSTQPSAVVQQALDASDCDFSQLRHCFTRTGLLHSELSDAHHLNFGRNAIDALDAKIKALNIEFEQALWDFRNLAIALPVELSAVVQEPVARRAQKAIQLARQYMVQLGDKVSVNVDQELVDTFHALSAATPPPVAGDAEDARRYRWLLNCGKPNLWVQLGGMNAYDDVEAAIDAAIAAGGSKV